jgi:hypothetical protein
MSSPSADHNAIVRQTFTQQAQTYAATPSVADPYRLSRLIWGTSPSDRIASNQAANESRKARAISSLAAELIPRSTTLSTSGC